ncbi:cornifelin homolog B-like [Hippocampus comes]|uniref:Cornifelin homolog B-like n=1 Tax=Hippocampus comes TaxID=109280 RepID=A0A3Q2XWK3_HIPCM|nr:PREDICTED: cornifelin homolog B-like [Hippocampus comes]XP_019730780.1 PREDICTED: cornifelin homolog B-like [Hippocampus comes]
MASQPALTDWNTDLFDCCESASTCCYGFWCCPCLACTVAGRYGENRCLPLCDIISPAVCVICEIPLFVPPAALSLRANMRSKYGIKGSLCKDIATSCFCAWCSWCQMHRELKYRSKNPTVINVFNQTVVSQPPPVVIMNPNQAPPYVPHY